MYCPYNWKNISEALKNKNYVIFNKEYNINIVGVRTTELQLQSNQFNDWICIFHRRNSGVVAFYGFQATTDPGIFWRQNPGNARGVGFLVPGQYRGMWKLGFHQGKYEAFVQESPVKLYRDNNKDAILDIDPKNIDVGLFGVNGHRAKDDGASQRVDKWSAACQVWADSDDFAFALKLAKKQIETGYGDKFTYTLLVQKDVKL